MTTEWPTPASLRESCFSASVHHWHAEIRHYELLKKKLTVPILFNVKFPDLKKLAANSNVKEGKAKH